MGRVVWASVLGGMVLASAGCFKRSYDARPVVTFRDLGSSREGYAPGDYRISTEESAGLRFPTRLAVARVTVANTECFPGVSRLVFSPPSDVERPPWHECLGDIWEVSEVFFLQETDFPRESISIGEMVRVAGRCGARLCLVYAESDLIRDGGRVIGVLMETRSGRILATLAAGHEPGARGFEVDRPLDRHEDDDRHVDARYQAALKFRRLVHECVLELKEREEAGTGVEASWQLAP